MIKGEIMPEYIGNCTHLQCEFIWGLQDNSITVPYNKFIDIIPENEFKDLFPIYDWDEEGLQIKDDYAVSFYKAIVEHVEYYFIEHSCIEYIWRIG